MVDRSGVQDLATTLFLSLGFAAVGIAAGGSIAASRAAAEVCQPSSGSVAAPGVPGMTCWQSVTQSAAGFVEVSFWLGFAGVLAAGGLQLADTYSGADLQEVFNVDNE